MCHETMKIIKNWETDAFSIQQWDNYYAFKVCTETYEYICFYFTSVILLKEVKDMRHRMVLDNTTNTNTAPNNTLEWV